MAKATPKTLSKHVKLTSAVAKEAVAPKEGDYILRDTALPGLALRIYASKQKSWIVQKKFLGKPHRVVLGSLQQLNYEQAAREARKVIGDLEKGIDPRIERLKQQRETAEARHREALTVKAAFEEYEEAKREDSRPDTVADRAAGREMLEGGRLWRMPMLEIKAEDLDKEYRRLKGLAKAKTSSNKGATQAGGVMRWLRAAFNYIVLKRQIVVHNPFKTLNQLQPRWYRVKARSNMVAAGENDLKRWWTGVEQLRKARHWQSGDANTMADYLLLSLLFGGRKKEMLTLRWRDVDFEIGTVTFQDTVTKNKQKHVIPFGDYAKSILARRDAENAKRTPPSEYVFNSTRGNRKTGERTHIKEPKKAIERVVKITGSSFSSHALRRTFATLFEEMGAGTSTVEKALNHAPQTTATRHYILLRLAPLRKLYQQFEDKVLVEAGVTKQKVEAIKPSEVAAFRRWQTEQKRVRLGV